MESIAFDQEPLASFSTIADRLPPQSGRTAEMGDAAPDQPLGEVLEVAARGIDDGKAPLVMVLNLEGRQFRIRVELSHLGMNDVLDAGQKGEGVTVAAEKCPG